MKLRTILAGVLAALALSVSLVAFGGTPGAEANDGDAIKAGQVTTETTGTVVQNTGTSVPGCVQPSFDGLQSCGAIGVVGLGGGTGVYGSGIAYGVHGVGTGSGTGIFGEGGSTNGMGVKAFGSGSGSGVYGLGGTSGEGVVGQSSGSNGVHGLSTASTASGVWGENEGSGYGVAGSTSGGATAGVWGSNSGTGIGVKGISSFGTGVYAAGGGTALQVVGKALFSRSGVATVAGTSSTPKHSVKVTLPITAKSMMTAMLQKFVSGVSVVAAVPNVSGGYFTIYLNKSVTTTVGPIAWMVMERP